MARYRGHQELADDFGGWIAERWLSGKSLHQRLAFSFIDFIRSEYGRLVTMNRTDVLDRAIRFIDPSMIENMAFTPNNDEFKSLQSNPAMYLREKELKIYRLYVDEGLKMKEIAEKTGLSKGRISQIMSIIVEKISRFERKIR